MAKLANQAHPGACSAAHSSPVKTPASGPAKSPTTSAATGSPKPAKRAGSPLALSSNGPTWGRTRAITWARIGWPASARRHLSPPPMRRDWPPAMSTPETVSVMRRSRYTKERGQMTGKVSESMGSPGASVTSGKGGDM